MFNMQANNTRSSTARCICSIFSALFYSLPLIRLCCIHARAAAGLATTIHPPPIAHPVNTLVSYKVEFSERCSDILNRSFISRGGGVNKQKHTPTNHDKHIISSVHRLQQFNSKKKRSNDDVVVSSWTKFNSSTKYHEDGEQATPVINSHHHRKGSNVSQG